LKYIFSSLLLLAAAGSYAQTALIPGQKLTEQINGNEKNTYTVSMQNGGYFSCTLMQMGKDLAIDLVSPSGKAVKTFDSPNGDNGKEPISFDATEKGNYKLEVYALEYAESPDPKKNQARQRPGRFIITDVTVLSSADYTQQKEKEKKELQAGISWMEKNAHAIKSTTPGSSFQDLQWMKPVLEKVKYVGLGEATHGTHEFFQMKHRMLEFLVKEMGFTALAIEASYSGCQNINDYVVSSKGNARTALASQGYQVWNTQEMLDMIEWLHTYNATQPADKKVRVYGFDIVNNTVGGGVERIKTYLKKVSPATIQQHDTFFSYFPAAEKKQMKDSANALKIKKDFAMVKRAMLTSRDSIIKRSSREEYESILENMTVISEYLNAYVERGNERGTQQDELRDRYMAENLRRYAQRDPEMKIAIWAHNNHINKNPTQDVNGGEHPMGSQLKSSLGNAYYAIGFLFNKGSFRAMNQMDSNRTAMKDFTTKEAKEGSMEWAMAQASKGNYIVNFRQKNAKRDDKDSKPGKNDKDDKDELPADVKSFTETEYKSRMFGASASEDFLDDNYITPITIAKDFDALIFIENTTAAKAIKKAE
jgi:erythromycin esterase